MRSLFWLNTCLAIFFGFFELVMLIVIVLYGFVLGEPRTSPEEYRGIWVVSGYVGGFVACTALTAWGLKPSRSERPKWLWATQLLAFLLAVAAIIFIQNLA